jgi:hypothetical protein
VQVNEISWEYREEQRAKGAFQERDILQLIPAAGWWFRGGCGKEKCTRKEWSGGIAFIALQVDDDGIIAPVMWDCTSDGDMAPVDDSAISIEYHPTKPLDERCIYDEAQRV